MGMEPRINEHTTDTHLYKSSKAQLTNFPTQEPEYKHPNSLIHFFALAPRHLRITFGREVSNNMTSGGETFHMNNRFFVYTECAGAITLVCRETVKQDNALHDKFSRNMLAILHYLYGIFHSLV